MPGLEAASRRLAKGQSIALSTEQARILLAQWQDTPHRRAWNLLGAAIMPNHVHLVLVADDQTPAENIVRDMKAYGSRALNYRWPRPPSGTWWTAGGGSRRWLRSPTAVAAALRYLENQPDPLLVWLRTNPNAAE